jgi:hypothetical protein
MKEAGCRLLIVGFESGDPQILKNIKKGATVERARAFVKDCHGLGLTVHGDFILGLPGETKKSIRNTVEFAKQLDRIKERQALVRSLTGNPDLNHMRIIVVGEKEAAVKKRNDLGRVTHVAAVSKLPATIRSVVGDPPHTITFPTSVSFPFAANEGQRLVAV